MGRPTNAMLAERRAMLAEREPSPVVESEVVAPPVRRFLPTDVDEWFMGRLQQRWPGYPPQTWMGKFRQFSESNEHLCVTNEKAVLLMFEMKHAMTGKPVLFETLAWARGAVLNRLTGNWDIEEKSEDWDAIIALYRYANEWRRSMGGVRMVLGSCSDMAPSRIARVMSGVYMVDVQ